MIKAMDKGDLGIFAKGITGNQSLSKGMVCPSLSSSEIHTMDPIPILAY